MFLLISFPDQTYLEKINTANTATVFKFLIDHLTWNTFAERLVMQNVRLP